MPADAQDAMNLFFSVTDLGGANYGNIDFLMTNVFAPDSAQSTIPTAGITDHGPQFIGAADVQNLFSILFTRTFKNTFFISPRLSRMVDPLIPATPLFSADGFTCSIQTVLGGIHKGKWFQHNDIVPPNNIDHYSKPISDAPAVGNRTEVPASAVFFLDGNFRMTRLSMYFDRYRMNKNLNPNGMTIAQFDSVVRALHVLDKMSETNDQTENSDQPAAESDD
jgi:hypothetical protein